MATVHVHAYLLQELTKKSQFSVEGDNVKSVIEHVERDFPGFREILLRDEETFQTYLMVYGYFKGELQPQIILTPNDNRPNLEKLKILTISSGG